MSTLKYTKRLAVSCIFDPITNDLLAVGIVSAPDGKTYYAYNEGKARDTISRKVLDLYLPRLTELEGVEGGCIEIDKEYRWLDFFTFVFLREHSPRIDEFRLVFNNEVHMHLIARELDLRHNVFAISPMVTVSKELIEVEAYPSALPNAIQYNAGWDARAMSYAVYLRGSVPPLRQEYIMPSHYEAFEYLIGKLQDN